MVKEQKIVCKAAYYKHPIDFFARRSHFIDHLAPIWKAIPDDHPRKGKFYIPAKLLEHAVNLGLTGIKTVASELHKQPGYVFPQGRGPLVCCAYHDMEMGYGRNRKRPLILMEHGVGLVFNHAGYAGGEGLRRHVSLFLAPNEFIAKKTRATYPGAAQVVIGTPKMDRFEGRFRTRRKKKKSLVAISFHWDGRNVAPEAGNAYRHYARELKKLKKKFMLLGHGHPKFMTTLTTMYKSYGIEVEPDFEEVLNRADLYVNDCSSTLYEFCLTGKPVVILNAPQFRRDVYTGIRFWDYTDIGPMVDEPEDLAKAIQTMLDHPGKYRDNRKQMIADLFPFIGRSAQVAANAILDFCEEKHEQYKAGTYTP